MKRTEIALLAVAGLAGVATFAAAQQPLAWARAQPGLWEISGVPGANAPVRQCVADIAQLARQCGATDDPGWRQELARLHTAFQLQRFIGYRVRTAVTHGKAPGPESSVAKLLNSQLVTAIGDAVVGLQGAAGMLWHDDARDDGFWQDAFLSQWSSKIGGGTEQVQRNIIGERVLGLPAEPRTDKDVPFRQLARA